MVRSFILPFPVVCCVFLPNAEVALIRGKSVSLWKIIKSNRASYNVVKLQKVKTRI